MFQDILKNINAFLEGKKAFLNYKYKEVNNLKNWDFLKGVSFGQKIENFPCFSFRYNRPGKCD